MNIVLDKIKFNMEAQLPFAIYSKPGSDTVTGLFQNTPGVRYITDYSQKGFVFAPFNTDKRIFIAADDAEVISASIDTQGVVFSEPQQPTVTDAAKEHFELLVSKSISAIQVGHSEKVVVSRKETVSVQNADVGLIFTKLLAAYPQAFRYCFFSQETGLWMGATPEQLLKADADTIHTVALAGTQLYKEGKEAVWPEKEQQEQHFVTDYILGGLEPFAANIEATEPYTFRAGNIIHIKTDIKGSLKDSATLMQVINTLHPTPAVCGLPKEAAKRFLLENEGYDREYYSGFLGELNCDFATGQDGRTDLFVNLRCMKIEKGTARLFIGCGITKDSDPEKEFIETVNKSMTMRRVL